MLGSNIGTVTSRQFVNNMIQLLMFSLLFSWEAHCRLCFISLTETSEILQSILCSTRERERETEREREICLANEGRREGKIVKQHWMEEESEPGRKSIHILDKIGVLLFINRRVIYLLFATFVRWTRVTFTCYFSFYFPPWPCYKKIHNVEFGTIKLHSNYAKVHTHIYIELNMWALLMIKSDLNFSICSNLIYSRHFNLNSDNFHQDTCNPSTNYIYSYFIDYIYQTLNPNTQPINNSGKKFMDYVFSFYTLYTFYISLIF